MADLEPDDGSVKAAAESAPSQENSLSSYSAEGRGPLMWYKPDLIAIVPHMKPTAGCLRCMQLTSSDSPCGPPAAAQASGLLCQTLTANAAQLRQQESSHMQTLAAGMCGRSRSRLHHTQHSTHSAHVQRHMGRQEVVGRAQVAALPVHARSRPAASICALQGAG